VFLGVLFHNDNTNEGIEAVLEAVHKYVPNIDNDDMKEYPISQGLAGDKLSVERGVNQLLQVANGLTPQERKEGLHLEIADFHARMKFLQQGRIQLKI
jgi:hypothetical protein